MNFCTCLCTQHVKANEGVMHCLKHLTKNQLKGDMTTFFELFSDFTCISEYFILYDLHETVYGYTFIEMFNNL